MEWDYYKYRIANHYLPVLINGDETGMSDEELAVLSSFIDSAMVNIPEGWNFGHWADCEDAGFCICEVTNLLADCKCVKMMIFK